MLVLDKLPVAQIEAEPHASSATELYCGPDVWSV